jgi:competence protein ComGC
MTNGDYMRFRMVWLILILLAAFLVLGTGIGYWLSDDTQELARRVTTSTRMKQIYTAISRYNKDHDSIPRQLEELVGAGYIEKDNVYSYSHKGIMASPLRYFPDRFGDPNSILLSENVKDIKALHLRLRSVKLGLVQMKGDGVICLSENMNEN